MVTKNDYQDGKSIYSTGKNSERRRLGDESLVEDQEVNFGQIESEVPVRHPGWGCQVDFGV